MAWLGRASKARTRCLGSKASVLSPCCWSGSPPAAEYTPTVICHLGHLGKGGLFVTPPLEDCLTRLMGSSTRAETGWVDLQLIGSNVADCQALTWHPLSLWVLGFQQNFWAIVSNPARCGTAATLRLHMFKCSHWKCSVGVLLSAVRGSAARARCRKEQQNENHVWNDIDFVMLSIWICPVFLGCLTGVSRLEESAVYELLKMLFMKSQKWGCVRVVETPVEVRLPVQ